MAIKQAQYKITLQNGEDIYHFETGDKMVKIVDDNKQVLGTFKEYAMEGKIVSSGSFKSLKISGIYKIKGVTGLPSGFDTGKISILSVKAVGQIGNPELVSYDLISQKGEVFHNTVIGSTETGWTNGGITLENTINTITNQIGDISKLETNAKASLVNAVNELKSSSDLTASILDSLSSDYQEFKKHDHDSRYIVKSGDLMTGHLRIANNRAFRGEKTNGDTARIAAISSSNEVLIGDDGLNLKTYGSEITFNNKKVWHEDNDGAGSGLDADRLGGVLHSNYARTDTETTFSKSILSGSNVYARTSFLFGENYAGRTGGFTGDTSGNIRVVNNTSAYHTFKSNGIFESLQRHDMMATSRETGIRFRLNSNDGGIGLYRNNSAKHLGFYDWTRGKRVGYIHQTSGSFYFDEPIHVGGRRLYMQGATPSGSIPTGSLWIS